MIQTRMLPFQYDYVIGAEQVMCIYGKKGAGKTWALFMSAICQLDEPHYMGLMTCPDQLYDSWVAQFDDLLAAAHVCVSVTRFVGAVLYRHAKGDGSIWLVAHRALERMVFASYQFDFVGIEAVDEFTGHEVLRLHGLMKPDYGRLRVTRSEEQEAGVTRWADDWLAKLQCQSVYAPRLVYVDCSNIDIPFKSVEDLMSTQSDIDA